MSATTSNSSWKRSNNICSRTDHPVCAFAALGALLFRLRPIGLALRALLCEEGNELLHINSSTSTPPHQRPHKLQPPEHGNHLVVDLPVGGDDLFSVH